MIRVPGDDHRAGRVTELVRTVDVMPTILELLGIAEESLDLQGRSLVPLMAGESFAMHAFSHARTNNQGLDPQYTVRDAQWRLTVDVSSGRHWLYDLETDPRETTNVADQHRGVVAELETVLMGQIAIDRALKERLSSDPETHELDEELRRELRSLGYLDGEDPSR
jgi:arylsulfatase A-like enzyme